MGLATNLGSTGTVVKRMFAAPVFLAGMMCSGCAPTSRIEPLPGRVGLQGISVVPPNPGWARLGERAWCKNLVGRPASRLHTICAGVATVDPGPERVEDLQIVAKTSVVGGGRFKLITINVAADTSLDAHCVTVDWTNEERDNPRAVGVVLLMTARGLLCQNPSVPRLTVLITYSERRPQGEQPLLTEVDVQEGEAFVHSLRFKQ